MSLEGYVLASRHLGRPAQRVALPSPPIAQVLSCEPLSLDLKLSGGMQTS